MHLRLNIASTKSKIMKRRTINAIAEWKGSKFDANSIPQITQITTTESQMKSRSCIFGVWALLDFSVRCEGEGEF